MAQNMEISYGKSKYNPDVTLLRIKGVIDADTAPAFEKELENLLRQGHHRLLVNLSEVEYISSAGIGVFVSQLQQARAHKGGDIKACLGSKKIMKVFESIGLTDMMEFLPDESGAKNWTTAPKIVEQADRFHVSTPDGEIFCGTEFQLRVEARDAAEQTVTEYKDRPKVSVTSGLVLPAELSGFKNGVWEGKVVVTAPGRVTLTIDDGRRHAEFTVEAKEKPNKAQFPVTVHCRTCQAEIVAKASDIYRCENCDETFFVDPWANLLTLKPGSLARRRKSRYKGMELKINTDVNYLGIIRQTISGLCRQEGMDEVTTNAVALAIEEILLNLIEHGNDFDPWQIFRLRMDFQKKQVKIQIRDYGDPYDVTKNKDISVKSSVLKGMKRGVGGLLVNQLMDQVRYESNANFNQLTLIKQYAAPDDADE